MKNLRILATLYALCFHACALANWQLSSPDVGVQVEFGTPVVSEFTIRNIGTEASPGTEMRADIGPAIFRFEYGATPLGGDCGVWRLLPFSIDLVNSRELRFSIPAIPAGGQIQCRYLVEQLFSDPGNLDLYLRPTLQATAAPIRLTIGALVDISIEAQLLSSQPAGANIANRYRIRFQNESPHTISTYGIGFCFENSPNFATLINFPGACRSDAPGLTCFSGSSRGLSAGPISPGHSASCEIETRSTVAPNLGVYTLSDFLRRADGRNLKDINSNNNFLRLRQGPLLTQTVQINALTTPALFALLVMLFLLGSIHTGRYSE